MSEEFQKHIFEPFARAEDVRIHKVGGAGLGMAIVKELLEAMGGTIHIDSIPEKGTTITVEMDLKAAPGGEKVADIQEFKRQQRKRIKDKRIVLIAEDNEDHRAVLTEFLEEQGFETDRAEDGEEVVDLFMESQEGHYKAVFMDIEMPVMDGCQATMMIRGLNRSDCDVPIIAMTACAFEADRERAKRAGMNDYLTKPLTMDRLEEMLKIWITESVAQ